MVADADGGYGADPGESPQVQAAALRLPGVLQALGSSGVAGCSLLMCIVGLGLQERLRCLQQQQLLHLNFRTSIQVSARAPQAKATARVDVPGTPTVKRRGQGVELVKMNLKGREEQSFPVFLRTLQGRHHVMSCTAGMLIADLHEQVANKCHMPRDKFMLVHRSKIVQRPGSLGEWGIDRDATLTLSARMLGGSGIPGEWQCAMCNRGEWWHTKAWCFRCGTSRAESEAILRGSAQGFSQTSKGTGKGKGDGKGGGSPPQREQSFPGRLAPTFGPQCSHAPTFHAPRPNKRKQTDTAPPRQDVLPQVVEILIMLGCSQDILDSVKSKVEEKTKTQHKIPGEKKRILQVLKMKLTKARSHLVHLQCIEKKEEDEYCNARDQVVTQEKYLADIQAQHDIAFSKSCGRLCD